LQNYQSPDLACSDSCVRFGCGDIRVYAENDAENAIIVIKADKSQLALNPTPTEFNLAQENEGLEVYIDFYYYLPENYWSMTYRYCTDIGWYVRPPQKWIARSGKIRIAVSEDNKANIELEDVTFHETNNENQVILEFLILKDIIVGWYPG
jgi:hypothetical protein